jgi:hypothetical protein
MQSSDFDFDVITGPSAPPDRKPAPSPAQPAPAPAPHPSR